MTQAFRIGAGLWQHPAVNEGTRKLLIVEDDPGIQSQLRWCFGDYEVLAADDRQSAINELRRHEPAVVLQDLGLPPHDSGVEEGFATLREILKLAPHTKIVVVTGHGDQSNAVKAVGLGAYDFYQKPVDVDTLQLIVARAYQIYDLEAENRRLTQSNGTSLFDGIVADSDAMMKVCRTIEKVALVGATFSMVRQTFIIASLSATMPSNSDVPLDWVRRRFSASRS